MSVRAVAVTVTTTAVQLTAPLVTNGSSVGVYVPTGGATVYLGGSDVTAATGFPVLPGGTFYVDLAGTGFSGFSTSEQLYAVVATGTQEIRIIRSGA